MQTCSIATVPFPHTVQQLISSTSNGDKIHLLEQRLTGTWPFNGDQSQDGAAPGIAPAETNRSSQQDPMETDAEAYKENTPGMPLSHSPLPVACHQFSTHQMAALHQAAPPGPAPTAEPTTAGKRRKTDRPQRRTSISDDQAKPSAAAPKHSHSNHQPAATGGASTAPHPQAPAAAATAAPSGIAAMATAQAIAPQAEASHSARAVKRSSSPSVVMDAGSNPPMSPFRAGESLPVPKA